MTSGQEDAARLARLEERQRCEKIIQNFLKRHQDNISKTQMLKSVLSKIRQNK